MGGNAVGNFCAYFISDRLSLAALFSILAAVALASSVVFTVLRPVPIDGSTDGDTDVERNVDLASCVRGCLRALQVREVLHAACACLQINDTETVMGSVVSLVIRYTLES